MELQESSASTPPPVAGGTEAFLALALDQASEAVFGVLSSGAFFFTNEMVSRTLGYSRDELLGMRVPDIDPLFPIERWPEHWDEVRRTGGLTLETIHQRKNGSRFPVEVSTRILQLDGQERMFAYARDLTVRKAAEDRLHTVVSNSQAVIYQLDAEGRFTLSEGRGLEGLGLRPGQVVGLLALEMYAGHEQICDQVRRALGGETIRAITELGGMTFDHQLTPVIDSKGTVTSVIGIATDITARMQAEEALRDSEARFRAIFEYEPECVKLVAEDGTLLDMNPAGLAMIEVEDRSDAVGGGMS